ncbi:hypothetical protein D3C75_1338040 [compost metagenome]
MALRAGCGGGNLRHIPVHVPFDIGNRRTGKNRAQCLIQIIAYFGTGEIQNELVARFRTAAAFGVQAPVRMFTV